MTGQPASCRAAKQRVRGAASCSSPAWRVLAWLFISSLGFAGAAYAATASIMQRLEQVDELRSSDFPKFNEAVSELSAEGAALSPAEQDYLRYLQGWSAAYEGRYEAAGDLLRPLLESRDVNLGFRARATLINVLVLSARYEPAFAELSRLLQALPQIDDEKVRRLGLRVAAYLYNQVGQYELGANYAEQVMSGGPRAMCTGGQLHLESLYRSHGLSPGVAELQDVLDACDASGEATYANLVRTYIARLYLDEGDVEAALGVLNAHYEEMIQARYPRLTVEFDALLAQVYKRKGDMALARKFATRAVEAGTSAQYSAPLAGAYKLLYELELARGDYKTALAYHEKYAVAGKGYLDDVSARQLAYERVHHESIANKLQIESLNKQNQVLQLQRELGEKAVENSRLYIALLLLSLVFIGFWAFKTKRSQLHFMRRSQQDGLTGIANRQHFLDVAGRALQSSARDQQEVSVILCDLDRFKSINDKYGHAAGDFVLQQAVIACQAQLRPNDIFGRLGGEEFGIVLPGCASEQARQRCEQLRQAIAGISATPGLDSGVSASFGVAATNPSGYELWQLLAHADAALYQAKHDGRNRVAVFDPNSDLRPTVSDAPVVPLQSFG